MNRLLLGLVLVLAALLLGGRMSHSTRSRRSGRPLAADSPPAAPSTRVVVEPRAVPAEAHRAAAASLDRTPIIARLARAEARRELLQAGSTVYLDSLFAGPDSLVRRWVDRSVILVAIGRTAGSEVVGDEVRKAIAAWQSVRFGVGIRETSDSAAADVVVGWVNRFGPGSGVPGPPGERTGLTELKAAAGGAVEHSTVWLALADDRGRRVSASEVRAVAIHELGHALGLPHSADERDIMYPLVGRDELSVRDRASLMLLYSLPPGPLREPLKP